MLEAREFGTLIKDYGYELFSGVPCSLLDPLIGCVSSQCQYIAAVNEGDAVAIAAGSALAGRKSVVLMQNSGLTNALSPLTSLNHPFSIPVLGFVGLRGEPGRADEPQHRLMGGITGKLLDLVQIKWQYLSCDLAAAASQLEEADKAISHSQSYFFVVREGTFAENKTDIKIVPSPQQYPSRPETLEVIASCTDNRSILLATTGRTGRELSAIDDSSRNFYMIGAMGCVGSFGLGLALARPDRNFIIIDGDGSLLMRMGSLAANGYYKPANLLHILLDNNAYESTGGQSSVSSGTDFVSVAAACGYPESIYVHSLEELRSGINRWKTGGKMTFLYLRIREGSIRNLGRPKLSPDEIKKRLQRFLQVPI